MDLYERPVNAEFTLHGSYVEMRCNKRVVGLADRADLKTWLQEPHTIYSVDSCMFIPFHGVPALGIDPQIPCRPLDPGAVRNLLAYL